MGLENLGLLCHLGGLNQVSHKANRSRILEWFGLGTILKIIQFPPLPMDRASDRCHFSWCFEDPIILLKPSLRLHLTMQPSIINSIVHPNAFQHSRVSYSLWWDWRDVCVVSMFFYGTSCSCNPVDRGCGEIPALRWI